MHINHFRFRECVENRFINVNKIHWELGKDFRDVWLPSTFVNDSNAINSCRCNFGLHNSRKLKQNKMKFVDTFNLYTKVVFPRDNELLKNF